MVTAALDSTAPTPPQARREDEPLEAWCLFLRWWATTPRPELENPAVLALAYRHQWRERAALLDHRTTATRPLGEVTRSIALDAVRILSVELEAKAAEVAANPGRESLRELVPLLSVLTAAGGLAAVKAEADQGDRLDLSLASVEERDAVMKALPIMARLRRKKS